MATTSAKAKLPPPGFEAADLAVEGKKSDASFESKGPLAESKGESKHAASSAPELSSQKDANLVFDNENTKHFDEVCAGFRKMHSHPINIVGHFVTTPLCL